MTTDLTAAVARLRQCTEGGAPDLRVDDLCLVLSALEAAQAAARRARECDLLLSRVLHELAGTASLCWDPRPSGVFDTGEALVAVERAINELRATLRGNAIDAAMGDSDA